VSNANLGLALEQDRALLAAFREGSSDVLERVYHELVDDVFRLAALGFATKAGAIRPERDHDEQRAIVQDVFVRAFADRARAAYDGVRPYRPYLLTIARNVMIDRARARTSEHARTSEVDVDTIIAADAPISGEIEEDADQSSTRERATEYLATLDAGMRAFVKLRFERDMSQAAVAAQLEITRRRVRTLEARVIKGLRRFLKKHRPEGAHRR
jgi:RNA polymerase sigma-70 factor (ECF subfamily)